MTGVYLEVDGKPVPAADCSWLLVAPCGCVPGLTAAAWPGTVVTTADEAMAEFTPNHEQRRRDVADGWTARLVAGRSIAVSQMTEDCPHDPKYGRKPRPEKAGHQWAAANKSARLHLAPDNLVGSYKTGEALCGSRDWGWSTEWYRVVDLATCRRCERAAVGS